MNRDGLVQQVRDRTGWGRARAETAVRHVLEALLDGAATDGHVSITGWGRLDWTPRAPRTARNVHQGTEVHVPARHQFAFKAATPALDAARNHRPVTIGRRNTPR